MNSYEQLLIECPEVHVVEKHFKSNAKGLCKGRKIGISKDIPTAREKSCILAEELGHYHTTVGNILDQTKVENRKQEQVARAWAYNKMIGLLGIVKAFEHGCVTLYDTAEYLEVTEEFLRDALQYYRQKYGMYTSVDNYVIYFEPRLVVLKTMEATL